jgi:hypothetical protein
VEQVVEVERTAVSVDGGHGVGVACGLEGCRCGEEVELLILSERGSAELGDECRAACVVTGCTEHGAVWCFARELTDARLVGDGLTDATRGC